MTYQGIESDLVVQLSTDQQELMSGGQFMPQRRRYQFICYAYEPYSSPYPGGGYEGDEGVRGFRERRQ